MKLSHFISLFFALAVVSPAEMVFEKALIEINVGADEDVVTGEFPFVIKGEDATITEYEALCTCLAARVEPLLPDRSAKLSWKSGEKGVIKARFDTSKFLGTVDKAIRLRLKGQKEPVILTVRVHIPELVKLEPATLKWDKDGEAVEKVVKITMQQAAPIRIVNHSANNEKIYPYELRTIKEGFEYEIRVKPTGTSESGMGVISLRTDCEIPKFRRANIYVVTRPKLKAAAGVEKK